MKVLLTGIWLATLLAPSPAQEGDAEIAGLVRFTGTHKPRLINAQIDHLKHGVAPRGDKDVFDEDVIVGPKGELANALVRIKSPVKGKWAAADVVAELDAAGYFFKPRVVALQAGQKLRLQVSGMVRCNFNVRTRLNRQTNVGIARGDSYIVDLPLPETAILVRHDCAAWQIAWVHVIEHPFFAVTGADGKFRIAGLPAGTYDLELWHEKFGVREAKVTVGAKESKIQDFTIDP